MLIIINWLLQVASNYLLLNCICGGIFVSLHLTVGAKLCFSTGGNSGCAYRAPDKGEEVTPSRAEQYPLLRHPYPGGSLNPNLDENLEVQREGDQPKQGTEQGTAECRRRGNASSSVSETPALPGWCGLVRAGQREAAAQQARLEGPWCDSAGRREALRGIPHLGRIFGG